MVPFRSSPYTVYIFDFNVRYFCWTGLKAVRFGFISLPHSQSLKGRPAVRRLNTTCLWFAATISPPPPFPATHPHPIPISPVPLRRVADPPALLAQSPIQLPPFSPESTLFFFPSLYRPFPPLPFPIEQRELAVLVKT